MQPTPEVMELAALLCQGEAGNSLDWTATTEPGEYRLVLDEGLIRIAMRKQNLGKNADGDVVNQLYSLVVVDRVGATVLGADVEYDEKEFPLLVQLYEKVSVRVNRNALSNVVRELKGLLQRRGEAVSKRAANN